MAYEIKKTDGTIIAEVPDGQIDQLTTDLTLIGKNFSGYGDELNENFVHLLENFADTKRPTNPITGQLWFDTTENSLKIYDGNGFVPVSSTAISESQPAGLRVGDLWYDTANKQLNFYNGEGLVLISPIYSQSQGKSGFDVESILDTLNQTRVVTMLYNNGTLLGIFSKDTFTPKQAIQGFEGEIKAGFTAGTIPNMRFDVTCTNSDALDGYAASDFHTKAGQLQVKTDEGIEIGLINKAQFRMTDANLELINITAGQALKLMVHRSPNLEDAVTINPNDRTIWLYKDGPTDLENFEDSVVEVGGQLIVHGDMTVKGETTTINTTELVIEDKVVTIANHPTPTDITAEGAGILVASDTEHSIKWNADAETITTGAGTVTPSTGYWTSTEHMNLAAGQHYSINGTPLIQPISATDGTTKYKLTEHITEIEGISVFGKRENLRIGPNPIGDPELLRIEDSTITTYSGLDLNVEPAANVVLGASTQIKNVAEPTDATDAATKGYVDTKADSQPIFLSMPLMTALELDLNDFNSLLGTMITPAPPENTVLRLLCTVLTPPAIGPINVDVNANTAEFNTPTGTAQAVISPVTADDITVPASELVPTRIIKTFKYSVALGWQPDPLTPDVTWTP